MRTRATITAEVGESFLTCGFLISIDEKTTPLFRAATFSSLVQDDSFGLNVKVVWQEQLLKGFYVGFGAKEGLIHFFRAGEDLFA
jgi:hypothetical protein